MGEVGGVGGLLCRPRHISMVSDVRPLMELPHFLFTQVSSFIFRSPSLIFLQLHFFRFVVARDAIIYIRMPRRFY